MIRWIRMKLQIRKVAAQKNMPDASYAESSNKVSIKRNPVEEWFARDEKNMNGLTDQDFSEDGQINMNIGLAEELEAAKDGEIKMNGLVDREASKDEEIRVLKYQLRKKDEEIRRHQKAMKTICSDLRLALEAAKELRQQENPWLHESTTGFMFYNLESAYATAQTGELNQPYWWRGKEDLLGAKMSETDSHQGF